jgi:metal-responsive CopG/Arc/MetJ family transcriptional regulator
MSTDQATARYYRGTITMTLPLALLRRMEPYAEKRQRTALIEDAIRRELDRREQQERQPA